MHATVIRSRVCDQLRRLGVDFDPAANVARSSMLTAEASPVRVRVIPANAELVITRQTLGLVRGSGQSAGPAG